MHPPVEISTATPDLLEAAADAGMQNHVRQNSLSARVIRKLFGACAYCVTTGGSGLLAGHLGCVITPALTLVAPSGTPWLSSDPYNPMAMLGIGFAVNAAILGMWYDLRERYIDGKIRRDPALNAWYEHEGKRTEKRIRVATVAVAVASLLGTTAYNTPHMYDMRMAYAQMTGNDPARRDLVIANARDMGQTLDEYLMIICSSPNGPTAGMSSWDKIKASFMPMP